MLTLSGLKVEQGEFTLSADLSLATGTLAAVIGPSGGGKSTLLNTIAGFIGPATGTITWNGTCLDHLPPWKRPISMVFQDNNLFPHLTVFQNVALGLKPSMVLNADEQGNVNAALAKVGLAGYEKRKPSALSGGQQSRVALARVLVREQPLMLLDEPFAALGPALRAEMLNTLTKLVTDISATVLMVTHTPQDAIKIASHTIYVESGRVHEPTRTKQLMENPPKGLREYLG